MMTPVMKTQKQKAIFIVSAIASLPYLDIVSLNARGMCVGDNLKSHTGTSRSAGLQTVEWVVEQTLILKKKITAGIN